MKDNDNLFNYEKYIAPQLDKTIKILSNRVQEHFSNNGLDLTKEQMIVLKNLHDKDGLNQNELAFLTLRNKSSLTRLLSKMEKKDYILRKQCECDRRINKVFLTKLGREIFNETRPIIKIMMATVEKNISKQEKKHFISILQKIQANFI